MDDFQQAYENHGLFLVVLDDKKLVGTGALKWMDKETAELKRSWLLEHITDRELAIRVVMQLFDFARKKQYSRIRLQTGQTQIRALEFINGLG